MLRSSSSAEGVLRERGVGGARCGGGCQVGEAASPFVQALQRAACTRKPLECEVERQAVMRGDQGISDFPAAPALGEKIPQGVEVPGRFGHLPSVHHEMGAVHPEIHEFEAGAAFRLRNFGLVVRENVVHPPAMDVDPVAEQGGGHGAAFDVPSRASAAPRAVPGDMTVVFIVGLPEREVADVLLFVFVGAHTAGGPQFVEIEMGQLPVGRETGDAEVNRFVLRLVGVARRDQLPDHVNHPGDVDGIRGAGETVGRLDAEHAQILEERVLERLRELGQRHPFIEGSPDGLVVHIGEVHHTLHMEAPVFEVPLEEILEDVGAEVPDVGVVVNRRPAGVDLDRFPTGIEGGKGLDGTGEGVVELQRHGHGSSTEAMASAAMPSPRPRVPNPSLVVALSPTRSTGSPRVAAREERMAP